MIKLTYQCDESVARPVRVIAGVRTAAAIGALEIRAFVEVRLIRTGVVRAVDARSEGRGSPSRTTRAAVGLRVRAAASDGPENGYDDHESCAHSRKDLHEPRLS